MNKEQAYLLRLITAAVNGTKPQKCEGINLKYLYEYSAENQFDHIIYKHFVTLGIHDEENPIMHSFHQRYGRAIVRDNAQDMALAEISEKFSENDIPHIPLKGSVVKKYYPFPEIRRSGDIDVLIHEHDRTKADKALKLLGYECERSGDSVEDIYKKGKTVIELHVRLSAEKDIDAEFCNDVWNNIVLCNGKMYEMKKEYLYVYLLAHLRKHLIESGGGGIKLILDIWVLNDKLSFDKEKLNLFLEQANITNLCRYAEALSRKWFGGEESADENVLMLEDLILNSGAYGNYSKYLDITLSRNAEDGFTVNKIRNFIRLICPPLNVMENKYPIVKKYPALLPFSWIKRVLDAQREHTKAVAKSVNGLSKKEAKKLEKFCSNIER